MRKPWTGSTQAVVMGLLLAANAAASEAQLPAVPPAELDRYWVAQKPLQPSLAPLAAMNQLEGCYVVEFDIDEAGRGHGARIVQQHAEVKRRSWFGMKPRQVAKAKQETLRVQEQAIITAVEAAVYELAPGNDTRRAVRTWTAPIVVSTLEIPDPNDAKAVAQAKADAAARREALFETCATHRRDGGTPSAGQ